MNHVMKVGFAALAIAAVAPAGAAAAEAEVVEEGAIGWTPVAVGVASPVQLPWGHAKWDVFGIDFNLLYSGAPKMYGIDFAGSTCTFEDMIGVTAGLLFNYSAKDVYGLRATVGANVAPNGVTYGVDVGSFGYRKEFWGLDANLIGSIQDNMNGVQFSGIANICKEQSYGLDAAIGVNMAKYAYGCQCACVFNMTDELHGAQIALVNYADNCAWGFQVGIINIIMSNQLKILPFVNGFF